MRHALPAVAEGIALPAGIFYVLLVTLGYRAAVFGAFGCSLLTLARRALFGRRVPGTLLFSATTLLARTVVGLVTGSAFFYFVQPTAGTMLVGLAFLCSAILGRPLTARLAHDFVPLDAEFTARPAVRRFFLHITYLWSAVMLANAGVVFWLLVSSSLRAFVVERTAVSWGLTLSAIALSVWWFVRTMRGEGIRVRWGTLRR